jgi:hypothetical protein
MFSRNIRGEQWQIVGIAMKSQVGIDRPVDLQGERIGHIG